MNKEKKLNALFDEMSGVDLPLDSNLVFGEGNPNCQIMFIGEAPGLTEDKMKRPFVGRAGQLLNKMIESVGWKREDVYITNIVKRRPPENRDPLPEEIEAYKPFLSRQIEIISPKLIATLGRFSMNYFLPSAKISRDQGKLFTVDNRQIFPIFHPAAALRNPLVMKEFALSFKTLSETIKNLDSSYQKPIKDSKTTIHPTQNHL
jgi:DNA polymerase